jgi:hypothetical protein
VIFYFVYSHPTAASPVLDELELILIILLFFFPLVILIIFSWVWVRVVGGVVSTLHSTAENRLRITYGAVNFTRGAEVTSV